MASWKSLLSPCTASLFKVDAIWNDGQESYVKKFNNGIPTLIHNQDFYKSSQFFLLLSGKDKKNIPSSTFIELPELGLVKLFSSSREFAELFKLHWGSVGVNNITISDNVEKKGKRPSKKTVDAVIEFFNDISSSLTEDAIKKSNELCDKKNNELHAIYISSKPVGKPRGRKPKVLTPLEIAHRERIKQEKKQKKIAESQLARTQRAKAKADAVEQKIVHVDIDKYINESLKNDHFSKKPILCKVTKDNTGIFRLNSTSETPKQNASNVMTADFPFRTRKAANAAKKLLEEAHSQQNALSPFTLYITSSKAGADSKTYHKVCDGFESLMSVFSDDWSGTPLGFSLQKSTNNNLGKFMSQSDVIDRLIALDTPASSSFGIC